MIIAIIINIGAGCLDKTNYFVIVHHAVSVMFNAYLENIFQKQQNHELLWEEDELFWVFSSSIQVTCCEWLKVTLNLFPPQKSLSKNEKSTSEEDISRKSQEIDPKEKLKCSTLPSSKNRGRSLGVGKSDVDIDDTTDEMMDQLVKTVTSKKKSRVRRRERSSMANRKSRKFLNILTTVKTSRVCPTVWFKS